VKLSRVRHDSRLQRRAVLGFYAALVLAAAAVTGVLAWLIPWSHHAALGDRAAEIGDVLVGGTLVLAFIAGLVALQAYAAATGLPNLEIQMTFPFSSPNNPVFLAKPDENQANIWILVTPAQSLPVISVRNVSGYSARNPAVVIRLTAMGFVNTSMGEGWTLIDAPLTLLIDGSLPPRAGATLQWDGGIYSIHGHSSRRLPKLDFDVLHTVPEWGEPKFVIELLAEGYRKEIEIPARFTLDPKDSEWHPEIGSVFRKVQPSWL
jgi:hypothetical protein